MIMAEGIAGIDIVGTEVLIGVVEPIMGAITSDAIR